MKNSALKLLAQKAKKRLSTAGQCFLKNNKDKTTTSYLSHNNYAIVAHNQQLEEDPMFDKIKKLMQKQEIINPLADLIDEQLFNSMTAPEKEKYILGVSKKYNEIKNYFIKNGLN